MLSENNSFKSVIISPFLTIITIIPKIILLKWAKKLSPQAVIPRKGAGQRRSPKRADTTASKTGASRNRIRNRKAGGFQTGIGFRYPLPP